MLALSSLYSPKLINRKICFNKYNTGYEIRLVIGESLIKISDLKIMHPELGPIYVKDSPHFSFVLGNLYGNINEMKHYEDYYMKYYPQLSFELVKSNFLKLINQLESNSDNILIAISKEKIFKRQIIIYDGAHRVAWLAANGKKFVKCAIIF